MDSTTTNPSKSIVGALEGVGAGPNLNDVDDGSKSPNRTVSSASKIRGREDEVTEAAEQRRLWALAATSAAHLIAEFTDKPLPDLEAIKKAFTPTTASEWLRRREVATQDEGIEVLDNEEGYSTEADKPGELFYDVDANDDDLKVFLDDSDQDLALPDHKSKKSIASVFLKETISKKETISMADKVVNSARRSLAVVAYSQRISSDKDTDSPKRSKSRIMGSSSSVHGDGSTTSLPHESMSGEDRRGTDDRRTTDEKRPTIDSVGRNSIFAIVSRSGSGLDEENWDMYDERQNEDMDPDDQEIQYQVADASIDADEVLFGLEGVLDDLQLESRITERYKYKLINKFSLLLQALITSQEREIEVIDHLQTKRKILTVLNNFVKSEAEMSAKVIVSDEQRDDDQDQGLVLDFHVKTDGRKSADSATGGDEGGGGEKQKAHTDSQGLSIEEMSAGTIRDTLLQQKNRLDVLEAIKRIHVLKLKQKEFEKTLLTLHYGRMVKPADLQKEIREARRVVNDLQLEISSMHQEMGQTQTEVRIQEKGLADEEKLVEKLELEALTKQNEVQTLQNKPIHIQKEADREAQKLEQLQDMHDNLCDKHMEGLDSYRTFQSKIDKYNLDLNNLIRDEGKLTLQKKNCVRETERLLAQMSALLTREQIMLDRAALMAEKVQQAAKLKKKIHDEQQRVFNEASKALRVSQRLERAIRMASEAYINARLAHDKMRAAFDSARPTEEDMNWQKLSKMLEREIQNLKMSLEKKIEESNVKSSMVDRIKTRLNELYDEQVASGKELQELIRTTVRKRREREEKSEQCIKLDGQIQRFDQDIKVRGLVLDDCARSNREIGKQIEVYKQRCGILKLERSTIMNEVISTKHKLGEGRAALKSLETEVMLLSKKMLDWEKSLKEKHFLILNARLARDSVRNDALRSRDKFRHYRQEKFELLLGNKTLRRELGKQKQDVAVIRKDFEKQLSQSNDIAVNVRERIEEICTFSEYIHAYNKILMRGAGEITVRELERTKLNSLSEELRKHVLIVKMNQPDESVFFGKIENLRATFYEITDKRRMLEKKLNEDDNPDRVREINFDLMKVRENIPALENRLDNIEELLATRDAMGLERTLMEKHISKITDDSLSKALHLKDAYGEQIKSMVHTRKNLNLLSKKIDGFICENSIASAQAETAEVLFLKFRKQIADAEAKFARGLSPTAEMEAEWIRKQWRKDMMAQSYKTQTNTASGFLRKVKPATGSEIQAGKLRLKGKQRQLEDPASSILGWSFSAISDNTSQISLTQQQPLFRNSVSNPRRMSRITPHQLAKNSRMSRTTAGQRSISFPKTESKI